MAGDFPLNGYQSPGNGKGIPDLKRRKSPRRRSFSENTYVAGGKYYDNRPFCLDGSNKNAFHKYFNHKLSAFKAGNDGNQQLRVSGNSSPCSYIGG
jgi:hypothetical protein